MKNKIVAIIVCLGLTLSCIPDFSVWAGWNIYNNDGKEDIKMISGDIMTISAHNPQRVSIRNPGVIDVKKVNADGILIAALQKGVTTLTFWDQFGRQQYTVRVVPEEIDFTHRQIKEILQNFDLPNVYTVPVEDEGKVLLMGSVKNKLQKDQLLAALGELNAKITDLVTIEDQALVEIEVEVLEIQKDGTRRLGIQWPTTLTLKESTVDANNFITQNLPYGEFGRELFALRTLTRTAFSATLNLLVQEGSARILSRPNLVCQSGKKAELLVGGEVPIMTTQVASAGGEGTEVEYKEYGIKFNIRPTVIDEGRVQLDLNVDISDVGTVQTLGDPDQPSARAYPLTRRTVSSQLYLKDGETLAIGGLIKQKTEEDLQKFPWLGEIPVLGVFFRHKEHKVGGGSGERGDTELVITLTPKIVARHIPKKPPVLQQTTINSTLKTGKVRAKKDIVVPEQLYDYVTEIQSKIKQHIAYPKMLHGTGWQGELVVKLTLDYTGQLTNAVITQSSGYKIFDNQTLKLVKNLSYPPFPPHVYKKSLDIEVPVIYRDSEYAQR